MQTGLRRTLPVAVTALVLLLVLAACGGGSDSDGVASVDGSSGNEANATATTGDKDPEEAALEFAKCMREHGVDMPDPGPNGEIRARGGPGNEAKMRKGLEACDHLMQAARPRLSEEQRNAMQDAMLAFAKCMREHGIDMPDPEFGEGGRVTQQATRGRGPDPDDPEFEEAQEACQPIVDEAARKAGLPDRGGPSTRRSEDDS